MSYFHYTRSSWYLVLNKMSATGAPATAGYSAAYLNAYSGDKLIAFSVVFLVLVTLFGLLRVYVRRDKEIKKGWDDYLLIPGWVANAGLCILGISGYTESEINLQVRYRN